MPRDNSHADAPTEIHPVPLRIRIAADVPAGNDVVVHFDLDLNGMLKVSATERALGLSKTVAVDTRGKSVIDFEAARRNVASLVGEQPAAEENEDSEAPLASAKDLRKFFSRNTVATP